MGVFEKAIPRYVYNPVQRNVQPVQEYYVDDIFDPLFNKSVREALTQKYGNPLLGTAMGYYEGIENALFGQDDKWGILGPGMGILSGFGRSMDKAGDVILGSLTETVKGATGQGFENPFQNIFVEDQDYTGKRALAAIANSMRGLAGGTTITEEDLGSAWNLPSLGIELTTDPSILGGNLIKASKMPSVVKQLGNADNALGKVGKFLQDYDDVMARASIDLTAPGLRPAIKALRDKFDTIFKSNFATKYSPFQKVFDPDFNDPTAKDFAKQIQKELASDETLATAAAMDSTLTDLETRIEEALKARGFYDEFMKKVRDNGTVAGLLPSAEYRRQFDSARAAEKQVRDAELLDALTPVEEIPNLTGEALSDARIAHEVMKLPRKKLRKLISEYTRLVSYDIDAAEAYSKAVSEKKTSLVEQLNRDISTRNERWSDAVDQFIDYARLHGANVNVTPTHYVNDTVGNVYERLKEEYATYLEELANLSKVDPKELTDAEERILQQGSKHTTLESWLRSKLSHVLESGNIEYTSSIDLSPYAWEFAEFSDNVATNQMLVRAIEGLPKYSAPRGGVTLSPSQMGKLADSDYDSILRRGNEYADVVLSDVIAKNVKRGTFPSFKTATEFRNAFKSERVSEAFKVLVPDKKAREDIVTKLERILFPPAEVVGPYGKPIPYDRYRKYKDVEELFSLFRAKAKLNRIDDSAFGLDFTNSDLPAETLARIAHAPWSVYEPERFLANHSSVRSRVMLMADDIPWGTPSRTTKSLELDVSDDFTAKYSKAFEYYTLGRGKKVTARALREKFGTVFDDSTLRMLESDIADYRQRLDTIRHSIVSNSMSSEALFFKDLEAGLDELDRMYLQPANLGMSESRYDAADSALSLNAKVYDSEGNETELGDTLRDDGENNVPAAKKEHYELSSPYYSLYAFDKGTLWTIRQIIDKNPQVFRNFKNLSEAMDILSEFVQPKVTDDLFNFSDYVKQDAKGVAEFVTPYPGVTVDTFLQKFQDEVLPLAQDAISKGYSPIPSTKNAHKFPKLSELVLSNTPRARAYNSMLRSLVDDWGFAEVVRTNAKGIPYTAHIFSGKLRPEKFAVDAAHRLEFMNLMLRQPKITFEKADMAAVFSDAELFSDYRTFANAHNEYRSVYSKKPVPKKQKFATKAFEKAAFINNVRRPITAAELAYTPVTQAELAIRRAKESIWVLPKESARLRTSLKYLTWDLHHPQPLDALYTNVDGAWSNRKFTTPPKSSVPKLKSESGKVWDWFEQIRKAVAVRFSSMGISEDLSDVPTERASLRITRTAHTIERGRTLVSSGKVTQSGVRRVYGLLAAQKGDILKGVDFVDEICKEGMVRSAFKTKAAADAAKATLLHNVDVFNAAIGGEALQLIERKMSNGNYEVIVLLNTSNDDIVKQIDKGYRKLTSAKFLDTEFLKAHELTTEQLEFLASDEAKAIVEYLQEVDGISKEQARMLGFAFDESELHTKHVRNVDGTVADYVANDLNNGIDLDSIDEITTLLANTDSFSSRFRGVFGTQLKGRRYRGAYWNYDTPKSELFTYDLEKIAKGSLGDGVFANSNYQSFVDLFVNDNFKIHGVFDDVDDIRKFLYAGGSEGLYAGNLKNVDLCYAKFDENGRIIGIHRYDVYSDADLAKALENPDTILVPANVVDTLDKIIRKEIRLSNKVYAFINKHFTIPFKFGVLTNPGFLVGNLNDAYLKQAASMAEKYGTDVSAELAKVSEAGAMYLNLGNAYNAAIEKWQAHMAECGLELTAAENVPEILAGHAPSRKRLLEYLNGTLTDAKGNPIVPVLNESEAGTVMLWTKLQQIQHTSNSLREFDELVDGASTSRFNKPRNIVDRIFQGSGKYNARKMSTWGIFLNNPVTNGAMSASEFIENTMRGTAILNDLMHEGYTREQIFKILMSDDSVPEFAATKLAFTVDYADAVNAMYESNFNYERMSDFMEGVGKAMPFPTFFLKNLAYWLTLFVKDPQFFDHAITVHESMWQDRDTSEAKIEAEAKGRGAVPLSVPEGLDNASGQKLSKWFKGIFKPSPLQSMFGAFSLVNSPIEDLSYRLHPLISGSAQAVNQAMPTRPLTTFLGEAKYRPYSTDIYERNITQDDENFNPLAYAVHRANPYERAISTGLRTPNKMLEGQAQLSDFLPSIFQPDFGKK